MFAHLDINSFHMNSYKVCEHGFSYKDLFKYAPMIVSGHFHKKDHRYYDDNKQIVYLGSAFQHNFGDIFDQRGIYVFDLKDNSFEFIENTLPPLKPKHANQMRIVPRKISKLLVGFVFLKLINCLEPTTIE